MAIFNRPRITSENGEQKIKRYVHSPLTVEHNGINATITKNGKVILAKVVGKVQGTDEVEYDEVEIPASLVFKLANLLKATRKVQFVSLSELSASETSDAHEEE